MNKKDSPITTLTVFHFAKRNRFWAFAQMGRAGRKLKQVDGLRFYKMLGSGRGKVFSLRPDWSRYALLGVWDSEEVAREFFENSAFIKNYRQQAERIATVKLRTISAHGLWDGQNPFLPPGESYKGGQVAVLTRASIRLNRLVAFWRQAATVNRQFEKTPGYHSSIGIGEAPFVRQATFSIWENLEAVKEFAYGANEHRQTIQRVREEGWYGEELFARFAVIELDQPFP
ncbi:MAG: spheroidene monooxygenase [Chloroflexi bacterium]|nr:spheroidene monooxygenase [Chloroflexota bacterium]